MRYTVEFADGTTEWYHDVELHDSGWLITTIDGGNERWYPPHRIKKVYGGNYE